MNKLKLLVVPIIAIAAAFIMNTGSASATAACTTELVDAAGNNGIKVNAAGTQAYATIIVHGDANCRRPASLAIWKLPNAQGHPLTAQKFFGHTTKMYGPGRHTIRAALPNCYWQADLLWQMRPKSIHGDARYDWSNNPNVPRDILANFRLGGNKSCTPPTTTPAVKTPTCTIAVSKEQVAPGEKVTVSWTSKNSNGGNITGIGRVAKSGSKKVTINTTTTFTGTFGGIQTESAAVCSKVVTVVINGKPIPPTTPIVSTASAQLPATLPNTGSGAVVAVASTLTATLSAVGHYFYQKRKNFLA